MPKKAQDDNLVMELVESALTKPPDQRKSFLKGACANNPELFDQAWSYVQVEQRMDGFLLDPICQPFAPEHTFQPGEILDGRFRIVREVAQGGMGVVYEAIDEKLKRRIAIKCAKAGFRQQLPPEVRNASEISHPNVCRIFEIHTASTRRGEIDFITMEFLEGETLAERLRRGTLPEADRRNLALQLCAGLAEAHSNGVIHGDLKSGNIILTEWPDGSTRAVITDFGLAHGQAGTDEVAQHEVRGGTPDYMAPELLLGEQASVASDIYALGVILHELACGQRPVRSGDPPQVRLDPKQPGVNAKWNSIVEHCLQEDPARRFQTAEEVEQAFAPSRIVRWSAVVAATIVVAAATSLATYQSAAPDKEIVRLAMLPVASSSGPNMSREIGDQLDRLSDSSSIDLTVIPLNSVLAAKIDSAKQAATKFDATHVLRTIVESRGDTVTLHAYLTDTRSGIDHERIANYSPDELRFIPAALAGFVTETLNLDPLEREPVVNVAAKADYIAGIANFQTASTVDDAIAALRRAVAADPDSPLTHAALAEAELMKYRFSRETKWLDAAENSAVRAANRQPDLAQVHRVAGSLAVVVGRSEKALPEFRRAIALNPGDGESYRRLGQLYENENRIKEAQSAFVNALRVEPENVRFLQTLGAFYHHRAEFDEAVHTFEDAVKRAPNVPEAHYGLATAYNDVGKFQEAETELRIAIALREHPDYWHALGYALMHQGRDREAIDAYRAAVRMQETALLWLNLGVSYERIGERRLAKAAFLKGAKIARDQIAKNVKDGRAFSEFAYLEARLKNNETALFEAQRALALLPSDENTRWNVAATYEFLNRHDLTFKLLHSTPESMLRGLLGELKRYPELISLQQNVEFQRMLEQYHVP